MRNLAVAALAAALAALALAACGGSSGSEPAESTQSSTESTSETGGSAEAGGAETGGSAEASTLAIEAAQSGFAYASETATAKAGKVTIDFTNPQALGHDVAIESLNGEVLGQTEVVSEGSDSTEIELKPGTYKFFCTVPGHREAGMEGTLVVE
jgi:plastocyanin